jgi:thioredoxin 1
MANFVLLKFKFEIMQTAFLVVGIILLAFVVLSFIAKSKLKNIPNVVDHENIITLTDKNFDFQTKNKIVLVDFWASWCAPCRMMAPVLNEVASELNGNTHVGKVNVEQFQSLAQKFKVRGIPTMILFKNGKEVNRFVGVKSKEILLKSLQSA